MSFMRNTFGLRSALFILLPVLVAGLVNGAACAEQAGRDGIVLNWEIGKLDAVAETGRLTDDRDAVGYGELLGDAVVKADPGRVEFGGKGAVVAANPFRAERLTVEVVFRVDRIHGPLQLIVTTHAPKVRKASKMEPGNSRQWFMQIRGEPPQQGRLPGFSRVWHLRRGRPVAFAHVGNTDCQGVGTMRWGPLTASACDWFWTATSRRGRGPVAPPSMKDVSTAHPTA